MQPSATDLHLEPLPPPLRGRIKVGVRHNDIAMPACYPHPNLPPLKGEGTIDALSRRFLGSVGSVHQQ
jgi:hypothetical protein